MKKYWVLLLALNLLVSCSDKKDETKTEETVAKTEEAEAYKAPQIDYATKTFEFKKDGLVSGCKDDSEIICTINLTIKCSIDPKFAECDKQKMPKFIFMDDESIERPTEVNYKIIKLKPLAEGQLEVFTQSTCNGSWFGLCNGNIIYVMEQKKGHWVVRDLYALQTISK